jgi:hypothetical protein
MLYHLSHSTSTFVCVLGVFEIGSHFLLGLQTIILISGSQIARNSGVSVRHLAILLKRMANCRLYNKVLLCVDFTVAISNACHGWQHLELLNHLPSQ